LEGFTPSGRGEDILLFLWRCFDATESAEPGRSTSICGLSLVELCRTGGAEPARGRWVTLFLSVLPSAVTRDSTRLSRNAGAFCRTGLVFGGTWGGVTSPATSHEAWGGGGGAKGKMGLSIGVSIGLNTGRVSNAGGELMLDTRISLNALFRQPAAASVSWYMAGRPGIVASGGGSQH